MEGINTLHTEICTFQGFFLISLQNPWIPYQGKWVNLMFSGSLLNVFDVSVDPWRKTFDITKVQRASCLKTLKTAKAMHSIITNPAESTAAHFENKIENIEVEFLFLHSFSTVLIAIIIHINRISPYITAYSKILHRRPGSLIYSCFGEQNSESDYNVTWAVCVCVRERAFVCIWRFLYIKTESRKAWRVWTRGIARERSDSRMCTWLYHFSMLTVSVLVLYTKVYFI